MGDVREELLPCPFCGERSGFDQWPCDWIDGSGSNAIRCAVCHGAAPMKAWNRRALSARAAVPEPIWVQALRKEVLLSAMKTTFSLTRDELSFLLDAAPQPAGEDEKVGAFGQRFIDGMGWAVPCSQAAKYVNDLRKTALAMAAAEVGQYVGAGPHGIADEPALSAPADINSPPEFPDNCVDSSAPADVEALADEIGTESRKSGGVRLWEFSAVELREFARRLSSVQHGNHSENPKSSFSEGAQQAGGGKDGAA